MNTTLTLTRDELFAIFSALELFDMDREVLIDEDEEWTPTFEAIDSFYKKCKIEKTIQDLAEAHPNHSRTFIRKHVVSFMKNNKGE